MSPMLAQFGDLPWGVQLGFIIGVFIICALAVGFYIFVIKTIISLLINKRKKITDKEQNSNWNLIMVIIGLFLLLIIILVIYLVAKHRYNWA